MTKKLLILGVALIMCLGVFCGCNDNKVTEAAKNGAYFATGSGNEFAVVYNTEGQ